MEIMTGTGVFHGIAIGQAVVLSKADLSAARRTVDDTERERLRFRNAADQAEKQLDALIREAERKAGKEGAAIFDAHRMLLEDASYRDAVEQIIEEQQVCAEYAVSSAGDAFIRSFDEMDDEYFRARAEDFRDITSRVLAFLQHRAETNAAFSGPVILFAEELTPGEALRLDKKNIVAFVTRRGTVYSHTAILARTMEIPALISVDFHDDVDGKTVIVDGNEGTVYLSPTDDILRRYTEMERREKEERDRAPLDTVAAEEENLPIRICANINGLDELDNVIRCGAAGIGLFRSEFLFLEREQAPDEEEQFRVYRSAVTRMNGKKVVIRTMDIGADKRADYLNLEKEENPALGCRAIRLCFCRPELLRTQLRAILRASHYGTAAILVPMIVSLDEVRRVREILEEEKRRLDQDGIAYDREISFGIMIETPAAALISDRLAPEVDFFSIGTNDLVQYTMAADRRNPQVAACYQPKHEAVIRLIKLIVDNGHKGGASVGICGELAADPSMTSAFLRMGVDELSVAPAFVPSIKKKLL